jgi:predicted ATPase with chaperone activity
MQPTLKPVPPPYRPAPPERLDTLDISPAVVTELALRHIRTQGTSSLHSLSESLRLPTHIVESVFTGMRHRQLLHVDGMMGNDYQFRLTTAGKEMATQVSQLGQYAGPLPVSLAEYARVVKSHAAQPTVRRDTLRESLSDLVLPDTLLDQLGPAMIANRSVFLYGPTGGGKTSVAERLLRLYGDTILVPYAVLADGHVITVLDPVLHRPSAETDLNLDPRWVPCRRPCAIVGGELVPEMLNLRLDESSGIYAAPLQMKANNGIFVIDDFGRQAIAPRELLNRWIVPLDRRVDYLMLRHGVQVEVPFEMLVIFSTNLDPRELADEAFLRRIHNKVYVESVTDSDFDEIFHRIIALHELPGDPDASEILRDLCVRHARVTLRACYPADILQIVTSICAYEQRPVEVTREELVRAVELYFTRK